LKDNTHEICSRICVYIIVLENKKDWCPITGPALVASPGNPPHFDALTYLVQKIATLPRQFTFEILLKTDLIHAQNEIMDVLGVLEQDKDVLLLCGSTDDLDWLARELAKLPFDFIVHEPEQLRDALRKRAVELANLAEAD